MEPIRVIQQRFKQCQNEVVGRGRTANRWLRLEEAYGLEHVQAEGIRALGQPRLVVAVEPEGDPGTRGVVTSCVGT